MNALAKIKAFRSYVPLLQGNTKTIYLNQSFQAPMNMLVSTALQGYINEGLYNPHPKPMWKERTEETRSLLAKLLNASTKDSITFTRDTTEGLNLFQRSLKWKPGDNVVILDNEHPNQGFGWIALQNDGLEVRLVPNEGQYHANASTFAPYVDSRTKAIGLSSVMFHSGQKNDVKDIANAFRPKGIHVLADLTQQVGLSKIDVQDLNVSACAFSCHKGLGCPTGLGVLYVSPLAISELRSTPPFVGGGAVEDFKEDLKLKLNAKYHQSALRYEHTNNAYMLITALRAYLKFLLKVGISNVERYLQGLGKDLIKELESLNVSVIGYKDFDKHSSHSYVLKILNPEWFDFLRQQGVCVSRFESGIRVSFGLYNTSKDIIKFISVIRKGLALNIPLNIRPPQRIAVMDNPLVGISDEAIAAMKLPANTLSNRPLAANI
ncbi:nifs homolog, possible cysteine desulfurase, implicated in iron-sulfur cluster assembly [Schizosaccharomyces pombe]|uniref:Uncharacterized protein C11D3.10 n=1 Tax=Schizosaccharomyces pombe (strain 972 / ATCC 24843) TaxID=284812 RepID=YAOA_SCHPO|nr:putative cysteine desulfurase nifs family protein [Schizosaccharomyces pombe]Q10089.1 RecName: Full=Uncharacterized protein C11D3.10 [Schizosaccharomyces pombe 972h-]CAA92311.1 nifs homolog, possible cysteine desulfurase [Schizosaccharomyces pombe]|eukprot:NP_592807.1 putative cysteine desulfurase nifs family protein [Schizosaccharomyces pombe]